MAADVALVARDLGGVDSDEDVRALSISLIGSLLRRRLMRIGLYAINAGGVAGVRAWE